VPKKRVIKNNELTLQSIGFVAEPNRLGAEADEVVHQRLSKNRVEKKLRKGQSNESKAWDKKKNATSGIKIANQRNLHHLVEELRNSP
jgi:predicted nucleic acid-binding protein